MGDEQYNGPLLLSLLLAAPLFKSSRYLMRLMITFFIFSNFIADISACAASFSPLSSANNHHPRRANYNHLFSSSNSNNFRRRTSSSTVATVADDQQLNDIGFSGDNNDNNYFRLYKTGSGIAPAQPSVAKCGHSRYYKPVFANKTVIAPAVRPVASIVGGLAALPHELPWLARLQIINPNTNATQLCSANIISEYLLTTAAHCVQEVATSPQSVIAVIGEHDITKPVNLEAGKWAVTISRIYIHPNYSSTTNDNDIGLLFSERNLLRRSSDGQLMGYPICLPKSCQDGCGDGVTAMIAGWGATSETVLKASKILQKAQVPIIPGSTCSKSFANLGQKITPKMICAGHALGGTDSCFGDSGGPLMTAENGYFQLCGITSFGDGCGKAGTYGVYTRICTVLPWLNSIMSSTTAPES